nr:unnamed protein product [Naegleria fowleri]
MCSKYFNDETEEEWKEFFMPGRICLVGEHSDWAAISEYNKSFSREQNAFNDHADTDLSSTSFYGLALICPTDQGIHIRVREEFISTTPWSDDLLSLKTNVELKKDPTSNVTNDDDSSTEFPFHLLRKLNFTFETENTTPLVKSNRLIFKLSDLFELSLSELLKQDYFFEHVSDVKYYSYMIGVLKGIFSDIQVVERIANSKKSLFCHNYRTTLPMGKGVSSSAAICVLIARIFNHCYNLNWSIEKEIEIAFLGERSIGSECGKLDHACAYGDVARCLSVRFNLDSTMNIEKMIPRETNQPMSGNLHVSMSEDVPSFTTQTKISCDDDKNMSYHDNQSNGKIYMLLIDLNASKDTVKILKDLNRAFSLNEYALDTTLVNNARKYLLQENVRICSEALSYVEQHNAQGLGKLFNTAQDLFDRHLAPLCPSELTAPVLHSVLSDETVQELAYGGKGVGSGGDGSCLVCCKGRRERDMLREYLENSKGMTCLDLTL